MASGVPRTSSTLCIGASFLMCYHPPVFECLCLAKKYNSRKYMLLDPKNAVNSGHKNKVATTALFAEDTADHCRLQIWDPNSGTKKATVERTSPAWGLFGACLQRAVTLKFLRLTFPFVFWKLLARTPTETGIHIHRYIHYITLHYTTLHCIALHYITLMYCYS